MSPEDGQTFEEIFARYFNYVRSGCARRLSDPDLVEEAAQRVWVEFWESYDASIGEPPPYLAVLITSKSVDVWRERRFEVLLSTLQTNDDEDEADDPIERLCRIFMPSVEEAILRQEEELYFAEMIEAVRHFILKQPEETIEAIEALLQEGRRVSGSRGGRVGEGSPENLSVAHRCRLTKFRRRLREAFSYWKDDWGVTCDLRSLHLIER